MPSQGLIQPWGYYPLTWEEQQLPSSKGCIICLMVPRVNTKPMCCVFWICECMPNWSRYFQGLCLSSLYIYELPWKYIFILFHLITSHFTLSFCHQSFFHIDGKCLVLCAKEPHCSKTFTSHHHTHSRITLRMTTTNDDATWQFHDSSTQAALFMPICLM